MDWHTNREGKEVERRKEEKRGTERERVRQTDTEGKKKKERQTEREINIGNEKASQVNCYQHHYLGSFCFSLMKEIHNLGVERFCEIFKTERLVIECKSLEGQPLAFFPLSDR